MFCRNCGNEMNNEAVVCTQCGVPVGKGSGHCPNCGEEVHPEAVLCVKCGAAIVVPEPPKPKKSSKSKIAAGLLGVFLGYLGIHNFYLGYKNKAIAQVILGTAGGLITCGIGTAVASVWGLIEGILIFCGHIKDPQGLELND